MAATEAIARVVDEAKDQSFRCLLKRVNLPSSFLLADSFGIIYLIDLLDTKIKSRLDLEGKS
jgi:capsular polysaccharide biosynthesis protein